MPKFSSYLKAIVPSEKAIRRLPHWQNYLPISPKDQNDISGMVIPRVGANNWGGKQNTDLDYLQKMYDCHDLVHSCINLVSTQFALAKLKVRKYDPKTDKYNYVPDHPLQKLLDNPNSSMSGHDLRQSYVVHRLLFGTFAAILLRGDMTISTQQSNACPMCQQLEPGDCPHILWHFNTGPVTQIMPVHLDRLEQIPVETTMGTKKYFVYDLGDGVQRLVHPNNIITDPMYNSGGSFYGSSPTAKVQRWLEIDLGLSKQIGAYLMNNAIPSMILNLKPPKWTEGQSGKLEDPSSLLEKMKEKWMKDFSMNAHEQGYGNRVKTPAFVFGDLDILKVQDGIKDIVQKPLFYEIQDRIARAYMVPPTFFEYGLNYSEPNAQHIQDFYNRAIAPQLDSYIAKMERMVLSSYNDPTLELQWSLSNMGIASFLEDKKEAQWLKRWELGGITLDELREALGMNPFYDAEQGNDRYRTSVMSDGSGNTQATSDQTGQNQPKKPKKPDNRFSNDPQVDAQANGIIDKY